MKSFITALITLLAMTPLHAAEYHVSIDGKDKNDGSVSTPFLTISKAASIAQPGDIITVHRGTYREWVKPPRGGESDSKRITYRAAPGEKVVIKGSEVVKGWKKVENDTWTVTLPNSFFRDFNPFNDLISGDWFRNNGNKIHTGTVYQNGSWLIEAFKLEDVLKPIGAVSELYVSTNQQFLLNVAWLKVGEGSGEKQKIPAAVFAAQQGVQTADCSEGGKCVGWIEHGDWIKYEQVDFGRGADQIEIRAASPTGGGKIELRLDKPDGKLIGTCIVADTGNWQSWSSFKAKIKPVSGAKTLCLVFKNSKAAPENVPKKPLWFSQVDDTNTTIWVQFKGINPNKGDVEVNVRQAVFYPEKPGMNYITVRGFTMEHAATPWAPPTAEQIGLIGSHWSKGWIIENNAIHYSSCTGVTLGKYGDEWDNRAESAFGYNQTIERALKNGWSKENIGNHTVRNNHISHCGQAGIVGSMGAVFSTVADNDIHDIHLDRAFGGAEMAGIKFHGAIDTIISNNHIYRCGGHGGIWLDWMAQGTRVTGNLLHDNSQDLFVEVNHGPFLVDNNIFLSDGGLLESCGGGAYVHNLFGCRIRLRVEADRETPFHKPHSTEVLGLSKVVGDDERFCNNIFGTRHGLSVYDAWTAVNLHTVGNVFLADAKPSEYDRDALVVADFDPGIRIQKKPDGWWLEMTVDPAWTSKQKRDVITTESLGRAKVSDAPYVQPDGTPYRLDADYFGKNRNSGNHAPGPFRFSDKKAIRLKVWPKK